ncbi:hypothetical protein F8388_004945 [Cannabis sativa]|uniref:DUF4378 domain-containing protein n=1 Tax=Cannabis sativa TaxID=3483 RepID=A0A7J6HNY1_CANSA|nr:hypothetical protein F8388_004945 [Cannabis sativa]
MASSSSTLLLPLGKSPFDSSQGICSRKFSSGVVRCSNLELKASNCDEIKLSKRRREVIGLMLGASSLFVESFAANGAGLPPEDKPKLCDVACEKELENVCSNLSELRRQPNQLESDAPDERLIPPKPAEPEISETSAKPIGTSVFEEVEESYKTFAKDNDISLKDQRVRRVDHKLLHDLLNEALSTVLEPHRGISTVSKVERKSMNSSSFPTLHGNKLLNCVWEIICDHLYTSTDRSCYSLEDMVARDLRLSPWTREVDDEGTSLGREVEILILGDLVKERTANANDFVNGGSHVMEYGSRSIRAEKLYLYQKVLILPLLTSHPTITNYTWLWKL